MRNRDENSTITLSYKDSTRTITVVTEDESCDDIMRDVVNFLIAVGFHRDSIVDAMYNITRMHDGDNMADEYDDDLE